MVDVLRKPPEAGIVGLAGLERSLQPCGLCEALSSRLTPASTWSGWRRRRSCCARPPGPHGRAAVLRLSGARAHRCRQTACSAQDGPTTSAGPETLCGLVSGLLMFF